MVSREVPTSGKIFHKIQEQKLGSTDSQRYLMNCYRDVLTKTKPSLAPKCCVNASGTPGRLFVLIANVLVWAKLSVLETTFCSCKKKNESELKVFHVGWKGLVALKRFLLLGRQIKSKQREEICIFISKWEGDLRAELACYTGGGGRGRRNSLRERLAEDGLYLLWLLFGGIV